ncbi:MAG: hypothetical protein WAN36_07860 [Calditrichia bacterium]
MRQVSGILSSTVIFVVLIGMGVFLFSQPPEPPAKTHNLSIKKMNKKWRVVDANDTSRVHIVAHRGDKIVWYAQGSDVYFQFMDDKIFGGYTRHLKDGQKLVLNVNKLAKSGENRYAVFCLSDNEFATGGSPPTIIIEP